MRLFEFNPVIYPFRLWIMVDYNVEAIPKLFDGYDNKPIESIDKDTNGLEAFTMPVIHKKKDRYGVVIFIRTLDSMRFELMAHEASHAAKFMFEHINAEVAPHEPFEYVIGWICGMY